MKRVGIHDLDGLSATAAGSPRRRHNLNLHPDFADPVQRLCNAVEPGTYVRPHRHGPDVWELYALLRGRLRLLTFDDAGTVASIDLMGTPDGLVVVEIPPRTWHAVAALEPGTVFLEVKHGPYQPPPAEDTAAWAPAEGDPACTAVEAWYRRAAVGETLTR